MFLSKLFITTNSFKSVEYTEGIKVPFSVIKNVLSFMVVLNIHL